MSKVIAEAKVTECIFPEAIGMSSHFAGWAGGKPVARGKGANFNNLLPLAIDQVSSGIDACAEVKVYKL